MAELHIGNIHLRTPLENWPFRLKFFDFSFAFISVGNWHMLIFWCVLINL